MEKGSYSRQSLLAATLSILLLSGVISTAYATDYIDERKKDEEQKAKNYQKSVLNFDYDKIKNKDKGFKTVKISDIKKKEISRPHPANFKIIQIK